MDILISTYLRKEYDSATVREYTSSIIERENIVVHTAIKILRNDMLYSLLSSYEVCLLNLTKEL